MHLVNTAAILTAVRLSTLKSRPIPNVKKPGMENISMYQHTICLNTPLMLDKIVALATDV